MLSNKTFPNLLRILFSGHEHLLAGDESEPGEPLLLNLLVKHERHRPAQLVIEEPEGVSLLDVRIEGGAVRAVDLVASSLVPEVQVLLVVIAVDGGQSEGIALAGVHGVLPQVLFLAAVLQEKQSEP